MKSQKVEPISEEPSAGGFTIGEQSTAWASTVVVCDWANTEAEQKILREITWQFEHLRNLVGVPLSVKVSKREAAPNEPAPVAPELVVGVLVDVGDDTRTTICEWTELRYQLPAGTKLYASPQAPVAQDAERYRWLRANCRVTAEARGGCPEHAALVYYYGLKNPNDQESYSAEGLDTAIDAARAGKCEDAR